MTNVTRQSFLTTAAVVSGSGCLKTSTSSGQWPMQGYDPENTGYTSDASGPGTAKRVKWTHDMGIVVHGSPAVAHNRVYFPTPEKKLYALNAETGKMSWKRPLPDTPFGNAGPVIADETVIMAVYDGSVLAFDAVSGDEQWRTRLNEDGARTMTFSTPFLVGDTLYVTIANDVNDGPHYTRLFEINPVTGAVTRRFRLETSGYDRPAVHDETVYFALGDPAVVAVDLNSGVVRWRFEHEAPPGGARAPAVADGTVF